MDSRTGGFDAEIIESSVVLKSGSVFCNLELWHLLSFTNTSDDTLYIASGEWGTNTCLSKHNKYSDEFLLHFFTSEDDESAFFHHLFSKDTTFRLAVAVENETALIILPLSKKTVTLGMETKYDKDIDMIRQVYFPKMEMGLLKVSYTDAGGIVRTIHPSQNYRISYRLNDKEVPIDTLLLPIYYY